MDKFFIIKTLETHIADCAYGENPTKTSWDTQEGILISINEANLIVDLLKQEDIASKKLAEKDKEIDKKQCEIERLNNELKIGIEEMGKANLSLKIKLSEKDKEAVELLDGITEGNYITNGYGYWRKHKDGKMTGATISSKELFELFQADKLAKQKKG